MHRVFSQSVLSEILTARSGRRLGVSSQSLAPQLEQRNRLASSVKAISQPTMRASARGSATRI